MKFGLAMFQTDYAIAPFELGRLAEEHGFESLFFVEHTHIPASRETPYPAGGELPQEYWHTYDPFIALAMVAATTTTLRLATGLCLVVERDPIVLAKEVASLDELSGGRVLLGVGAGWNEEEMRNHGTDPKRRWGLMRERVEAMRAIWTQEEASYHGDHVNFDRIWSYPKPAQENGPPILVGGHGKKVLERVLAFGDEWLPNYFPQISAPLLARVERLQELAAEAGREPVPVTLYGAPSDHAELERFERAGVTRCVHWLPPEGRDETAERVERHARAAAAYAAAAST